MEAQTPVLTAVVILAVLSAAWRWRRWLPDVHLPNMDAPDLPASASPQTKMCDSDVTAPPVNVDPALAPLPHAQSKPPTPPSFSEIKQSAQRMARRERSPCPSLPHSRQSPSSPNVSLAAPAASIDTSSPIASVRAEVARLEDMLAMQRRVQEHTQRHRQVLQNRLVEQPHFGAIHASSSEVWGPRRAMAGLRHTWCVQLRDRHGTPAPLGTATPLLRATLTGADGHVVTATSANGPDAAALDASDWALALLSIPTEGALIIMHTPCTYGTSTLTVEVAAGPDHEPPQFLELAGSPLTFTVAAGPEHMKPVARAVEYPVIAVGGDVARYTPAELSWLEQQPALVGQLDLCFVLDATHSMAPYIESCKTHILHIIQQLRQIPLGRDIRIGAVFYRDHPSQDPSFVTQVVPLTGDATSVQSALAELTAAGGGDLPEAVTDALREVADMKWRPAAAKLALWMGDAPPHAVAQTGAPLHYFDAFPAKDPSGSSWSLQAHRCWASGIRVCAVGCLDIGDWPTTERVFRSVAHMTSGDYLRLESEKADSLLPALVQMLAEVALDRQLTACRVAAAVLEHCDQLSRLPLSGRLEVLRRLVGGRVRRVGRKETHLARTPQGTTLHATFGPLTDMDVMEAVAEIGRVTRTVLDAGSPEASLTALMAHSALFPAAMAVLQKAV